MQKWGCILCPNLPLRNVPVHQECLVMKYFLIGELPPERPKKHTPCEVLSSEPYVNIEFVKQGKDPNVTYSQGTIVRVACGKGYVLNMESNNTAKCVKGKWKPMKPECLIRK